MHSLRKACYTCVRCVLICENTVTCKTARGDPKSNARGDPKSNARGDPKSNARGDPKPNARGDPKSNARGDPKSNARGDPKSNAHVGPAGGVSRSRMCVQTIMLFFTVFFELSKSKMCARTVVGLVVPKTQEKQWFSWAKLKQHT